MRRRIQLSLEVKCTGISLGREVTGDRARVMVGMGMGGEDTRMEGRRLERGDLRIPIDLTLRGRLRISTMLEVNQLLEDTLLLATITRTVSSFVFLPCL